MGEKQARCKHMTCNGLMMIEHDRVKCSKCARSIWRNFDMRKPVAADQSTIGSASGSRANGADKPKQKYTKGGSK